MESIKLHFTPTSKDIVRSTQHLQIESFRQPGAVGGVILLLGFAACMISGQLINPTTETFIGMIISVLLTLLIVIIILFNPYMLAQRLRKSLEASGENVYEFTDDFVSIKDSTTELTQQWSVYSKAIATDDYYILTFTLNRIAGRFIPRRAFESSEQEAAFRELLARKLNFKG